jgi:predicted MFS family arabinose efflux permease
MLEGLRRMTAVTRPRVVGVVTVGHGVNEFLTIVFPPIIPLLVSDLGITYGESGLLLTVFFLMYVLFQLPAGVLSDAVGKRRVMAVGLAVMSAAVLLAALAPSYEGLLVAQAVAGIGGSTYHPTGMAIISDGEQEATQGRAMGLFGLGGALGTLLAPVAVGGLAALLDWRIGLACAGAIGLLATLAVVIAGSGGRDGRPATDGGRTLRGRLRRLRPANARRRRIVLLLMVTGLLSLQHRAIQTYTTAYVSAEAGTAAAVGNVGFFALLLGGSVSSVWAGDLVDRFRGEFVGAAIAVASALLVAGTIILAPVFGGLPGPLLLLAISGWFGVIGWLTYANYPVKNALVSAEAVRDSSGSLFGVVQTASAVGSAAGPALFGLLAEEWGIVAAFPAIAAVGLLLAGCFALAATVD